MLGLVWFLFFKIVFENTKNTILYFLNIVFNVFFVFFRKKNFEPNDVLYVCLILLISYKNIDLKNRNLTGLWINNSSVI